MQEVGRVSVRLKLLKPMDNDTLCSVGFEKVRANFEPTPASPNYWQLVEFVPS